MSIKIATKDDLVGVIGLGRMGGSMAANMLKNGWKIMGFDLVEESRKAFADKGGILAADNADLAKNCKYIILSLPSPKALEAVAADLKANCQPGTCVMECSTLAIEDKERVYASFEGTGIYFLDTPLSGNGFQAAAGNLCVFFSGNKEACEACYPFIDACARAHDYVGDFGAGMKMKFVANHLVTVHNVAAGEAMLLGEHLGLDPQVVCDVISNSAGSSSMFVSRAPMMVTKVYHPVSMTNRLMLKDVTLIHDAVEKCGVYAPLFEIGYQVVKDCSEDETLAFEDTAAAHAYLDRKGKYNS